MFKPVGGRLRQIRVFLTPRSDREPVEIQVKEPGLNCQEKLLVRTTPPVPKPTQVGKKRILR